MINVLIIFGTRPEAIKMAPVVKTLQKNNNIFDGFIGFDECSGKRIWTSDEVNTLTIFLM